MNTHRARLSLSVTVAVAAVLAAHVAAAEEGSAPTNALEEVVVMGQRTTVEVARAAQEQAPNLIDLMTAEQIQLLPDVNTGEAVRRLPGISLETDTGEGRYVNIRGLDADLNSTTFGGLRLSPTNTSSPSGAGRAVAFDSIPVGFVGAITLTKSNLPEQDAEAIGGTIDITPKTAPRDGKAFAEFKLGSGEETQRKTGITDLSFTAGGRFGGDGAGYQPFSLIVTGSLYNDGRGINDAEAGFYDEQGSGVADKVISAFEQRYYQYHRNRHGYGFDLGYEPDADNRYFVRYYDAGYTEHKYRQMLQWNLSDPLGTVFDANGNPLPNQVVQVDPSNPNGFVQMVDSLRTNVQVEKETLTTRVAEIGGVNKLGDAKLDYHVGYTKGSYYMPYNYSFSFNNGSVNLARYDNTTNPNWPTISVADPAGYNVTDPSGYALRKMTNATQDINDHEWGIGSNLTIPTHYTDRSDEEFKFGVNARLREKTGDQSSYAIGVGSATGDAAPISLASVAGTTPQSYYAGHYLITPLAGAGALVNYYDQNIALQSTDPVANQFNSVNDKEDVYAVYGQYQFGWGKLGLIAGVRVEETRADYSAYKQDATGVTCPINQNCPVSNSVNYTNVFPTAQLRYALAPDLIGRAAISSTIARPGFQQITPTTSVDNNGNVTTGNPNLKPTTATGFDLDIEKYLPHAGILSGGVFAKDLRNYIVTDSVPLGGQNTGGNLGIAKLFSFTNGQPAHVYGFEGNFVKRFRDDLPGAWAGLGVGANVTLVSSSFKVPVLDSSGNSTLTRDSILPSTSRTTGNFEVMYDLSGLSLTLGAYYTSRNIFSMGPTAATDVWTQERFSVDFGGSYAIGEHVSAYLNVKNLTNTALKFTEGEGDNRVIQREFYGPTVQFGLNVKL
jgi:TonB-dependent receptor